MRVHSSTARRQSVSTCLELKASTGRTTQTATDKKLQQYLCSSDRYPFSKGCSYGVTRLRASAPADATTLAYPNSLDVKTLQAELPATETLSQRWQRYAQVAISSALMLVGDQIMKTIFTSWQIQFPHTLAGMLLILTSLVVAKAAKGKFATAADAFVDYFAPLRDWIARWMPVFFVPALVALPLSASKIAVSDISKIAQVTALGWTSSLLFVVVILKLVRGMAHTELTKEEEESTAPKPVSPFKPMHYKVWGAVSAVSIAAAAAFPSQATFLSSVFLLASTVTGYLIGVAVPKPVKVLLHPLVTCALYASACCHLWSWVSGLSYTSVLTGFMHKGSGIPGAGTALLSMLAVVVLCDGMRVFLQRKVVQRHAPEMFSAILASALFSLFYTAHLSAAIGMSSEASRSILARSVTVALALPITANLGGVESLTTATVCLTGLIGAAFGQLLMSMLKVRDEISRGVAQGASGHGLGASALAATEPQALPFCAVTIAGMGTLSNILLCFPAVRGALLGITA